MALTEINRPDSVKSEFGTGNDLSIYHNGSNSYIDDTGTGDLFIRGSNDLYITNPGGTETKARFATDGAVYLYYNNVVKFETTGDGAKTTGKSEMDGDVQWNGSDDTWGVYWDKSANIVSIKDDKKIGIGTSNDLQIYHDGASYINNTNGNLYIKSTNFIDLRGDGNETMIKGTVNGAVDLYYDNSKKFETTSTGVGLPITANNTGIKLTAAGAHYGSINFDSNRTSENHGIGWIAGKWNGTDVAAISIEAGDDTTNKDDGKMTFYTGQGGTMTQRMAIEQDGNIHVACTGRPDPTTAGFLIEDDGAAVRWSQGGGTSGTDPSSCGLFGGGSSTNILASTSWGSTLQLFNTNSTDGNSNAIVFGNSNQLATSLIVGETTSHSSRNGELAFCTSTAGSPTEKARIDSSGNLTITDGNLVIGTSGHGIDFSATSNNGTSELLDDYEEGNWTPAFDNSITTHTQTVASYIKIGSQVTVRGQVRINSDNNNAAMVINNLPYAAIDTSGTDSAFSVGQVALNSYDWSSRTSNWYGSYCVVYKNNTNLYFYYNQDDGSATAQNADGNTYVTFTCTYQYG